jgi:hypothetical protein
MSYVSLEACRILSITAQVLYIIPELAVASRRKFLYLSFKKLMLGLFL